MCGESLTLKEGGTWKSEGDLLHEGAGGKFVDYSCVDCTNLLNYKWKQ